MGGKEANLHGCVRTCPRQKQKMRKMTNYMVEFHIVETHGPDGYTLKYRRVPLGLRLEARAGATINIYTKALALPWGS